MIPFIDLAEQQRRIKPQIDAAIARVLKHGKYIMGPEIGQLEQGLAEFVGSKHCISVSSGTDALVVSLMALNVGPGDAVITTPFTFFATVEAIMLQGATPIFADIDPESMNICPHEIRKAIDRVARETSLTVRGIVPVDLFGLPADYQQINAIADECELFVLQDSAQAFGATRFKTHAPCHGDIGITSFFPAKPLGCYGDGGAVFTDDDALADVVRSLRVHGKGADKYDNVRVGVNARLDTIQAAILLEKLKIYRDELQKRQRVASAYARGIDEIVQRDRGAVITRQTTPRDSESAWAQFVIRTPCRDHVADQLRAAGIPSAVYYRTPSHLLKACRDLPLAGKFPNAEATAEDVLALPFHPYMEQHTTEEVCQRLRSIVSRSGNS